MLANRLRRMSRHLSKWARRAGIRCYRLYDRDIPDHPLLIDWYDGRVLVHAFRRRRDETEDDHAEWLARVEAEVMEGLDLTPDRLYFRQRERQRGAAQYRKIADGGEEIAVEEGGHRFLVNLTDYLDTGLFLDHRITRSIVEKEASGKRFLNLFAYTGSFTVYAAAGGASETLTLDLSNTYLDWAERNFRLNGMNPDRHATVQSDALRWLPSAHRHGECFDLIVCDPPTFSNSKRMERSFELQSRHPDLVNGCIRLLSPTGVLYFSVNDRRFRLRDQEIEGGRIEEISSRTIPPDFRNGAPHRCWRIVRS